VNKRNYRSRKKAHKWLAVVGRKERERAQLITRNISPGAAGRLGNRCDRWKNKESEIGAEPSPVSNNGGKPAGGKKRGGKRLESGSARMTVITNYLDLGGRSL